MARSRWECGSGSRAKRRPAADGSGTLQVVFVVVDSPSICHTSDCFASLAMTRATVDGVEVARKDIHVQGATNARFYCTLKAGRQAGNLTYIRLLRSTADGQEVARKDMQVQGATNARFYCTLKAGLPAFRTSMRQAGLPAFPTSIRQAGNLTSIRR